MSCRLPFVASRAIKLPRRARDLHLKDNGGVEWDLNIPVVIPKTTTNNQSWKCQIMDCCTWREKPPGESIRYRFMIRVKQGRFVQRLLRKQSPMEYCVSCFEHRLASELTSLPCQHRYCNWCIRQMADITITDEQLFPPMCCSHRIPTETIFSVLSHKEKEIYISRSEEYATPVAERWYCPAPNCGVWISPKALDGEKSQIRACPHCSTRICSGCRGIAHASDDCPDTGLSMVLEVARLQRWQRCFNCGAVIELIFGCDHITCRCRAQFCYKCGERWPSCVCITPNERPVDFFTFVVDGNALSQDEEIGLRAVLAAMICHDYGEGLSGKERKEINDDNNDTSLLGLH